MTEETLESMDVETFVEHLSFCNDAIDPVEAFREICHEQVGDKLTPWEACRLELSDRPAFRQGCNDYADAQEKSREWVTFDNGSSYYPVSSVKEVLADYPAWEYDYSDALRKIIDFWL